LLLLGDPDAKENGDAKSPLSDVPVEGRSVDAASTIRGTAAAASISVILQRSKFKGLVKDSIVDENHTDEYNKTPPVNSYAVLVLSGCCPTGSIVLQQAFSTTASVSRRAELKIVRDYAARYY
jgi:hypothetical protein